MSKATNNTQRVTLTDWRHTDRANEMVRGLVVDGEWVGRIYKFTTRGVVDSYRIHVSGEVERFPVGNDKARGVYNRAQAAAIALVEEPAQAETVEAEEPAQAETVADHVVVTNDEGRAFSVVVVMQGDRYGLNDRLTHGSPDPLVEFYDAKHSGSVHGPLGQFVSRYYLSTLAGEDQWGLEPGQGLNLHGGVREWSVSWQNVCEAVAYARRRQAAA